ncbi:MAG TPA: PIN domain-containing protein [Ktedonobacterales bacterium]|jgi:predicted nucleic acid-binding protein|nr:PIN domain-containing protein [Ktedonobacterales bacterium]HEX5570595.1 PIN domain-containing protein [Ktedonobacterales bacterium]
MATSDASTPPLRVLVDTNVALDLFLQREPWATEAQGLVSAYTQGKVVGYVPASALTDIFYISRRIVGADKAFHVIDLCLSAFAVIAVDRAVIDQARTLPGADFEDNVQIACAQVAQLDAIVTRDATGFVHAPMPTLAPKDVANQVK